MPSVEIFGLRIWTSASGKDSRPEIAPAFGVDTAFQCSEMFTSKQTAVGASKHTSDAHEKPQCIRRTHIRDTSPQTRVTSPVHR